MHACCCSPSEHITHLLASELIIDSSATAENTLPNLLRSKQVSATTPAGLSAAAPNDVCTNLYRVITKRFTLDEDWLLVAKLCITTVVLQ
jgi:hypothetical protein